LPKTFTFKKYAPRYWKTFRKILFKKISNAEDVGVEPTEDLRLHGLANHSLNRSGYPPDVPHFLRNPGQNPLQLALIWV